MLSHPTTCHIVFSWGNIKKKKKKKTHSDFLTYISKGKDPETIICTIWAICVLDLYVGTSPTDIKHNVSHPTTMAKLNELQYLGWYQSFVSFLSLCCISASALFTVISVSTLCPGNFTAPPHHTKVRGLDYSDTNVTVMVGI